MSKTNATIEPPGRHGHGHHHLLASQELNPVSDSRLLWAVVLNQLLTVVQVVAGLVSGSVALLSDAAHNFSDANTLLIAYVARRISRRRANHRFTFGYQRAELIGATINLTLLTAVGVLLIYHAVVRLISPEEIIGWMMAAAAGLAMAVDVATAWMLWSMSKGSLNVRAAFIHNLADAFGSLAVLVGAGLVIWLGWYWVDSLLTFMIAGYVLWQVARMLPQAIRMLMQGTPPGMDIEAMVAQVESLDEVEEMHHVHVWELDEHRRALEAHVVIHQSRAQAMESIKLHVKKMLAEQWNIEHSTLEFEFDGQKTSAECNHVISDC